MTRVLVVEDEESFSDALSYMLRKEGFEVAVCPTGPDAIETFDRTGADLVLLDLMLPGLPGSEVCRTLRERSNVPVIMLTAKDSEIDKVVGLELGADDYVTKPFSSRELVARMRAVLRRRGDSDEPAASIMESGPVRMDVDRHVVTVRGEQVQLPLKEFELLEVLLRNAGRVLTRMQLIDRVWGADYVGDTKTLDVHVKRLRAKIEADPASPGAHRHRPRARLQVRARRLTGHPARPLGVGLGPTWRSASAWLTGRECSCSWRGRRLAGRRRRRLGLGRRSRGERRVVLRLRHHRDVQRDAAGVLEVQHQPDGSCRRAAGGSGPVRMTFGAGPVSSTALLAGQVDRAARQLHRRRGARGADMLSSRSGDPVLYRARNRPADCPAASSAAGGAPSTNTSLIAMSVHDGARAVGRRMPLLRRRVVAGLAAGEHGDQRGDGRDKRRRGSVARR